MLIFQSSLGFLFVKVILNLQQTNEFIFKL